MSGNFLDRALGILGFLAGVGACTLTVALCCAAYHLIRFFIDYIINLLPHHP